MSSREMKMPMTVTVPIVATAKDGKLSWFVKDEDMEKAIRTEVERRVKAIEQLEGMLHNVQSEGD